MNRKQGVACGLNAALLYHQHIVCAYNRVAATVHEPGPPPRQNVRAKKRIPAGFDSNRSLRTCATRGNIPWKGNAELESQARQRSPFLFERWQSVCSEGITTSVRHFLARQELRRKRQSGRFFLLLSHQHILDSCIFSYGNALSVYILQRHGPTKWLCCCKRRFCRVSVTSLLRLSSQPHFVQGP